MKLCLAYAAILFSTHLLADSSSLSSTSADYDGNVLQLKGQVFLDHGLGQMHAEEAFLERQEAGKDFPFSLIHLQKEVLVKLPSQAELRCGNADLDFVSLKGMLHATETQKVSYTAPLGKREGPDTYFSVTSDKGEATLLKKEHDGNKTAYALESLTAQDNVLIDYAQQFLLYADRAVFKKDPSTEGVEGKVTAFPKDGNSYCRLTHEEDYVDAAAISLDLSQSQLLLTQAQGVLQLPVRSFPEKGDLLFTAEKLQWDHLKNTLSLLGKSKLASAAFGTIDSEQEVSIKQLKKNKKRSLHSIRSQGKTLFHYQLPSSDAYHQLLSQGRLLLDGERLSLTIDSPEKKGVVSLDDQVYYEEKEFAVYANKAFLEYSLIDNKIQPVSLTLKGNVRLFSHIADQPAVCGLSDRVTYALNTGSLMLFADPGKKVLFWDGKQTLRIAAHEVHLTQESGTQEKTVKGIGNVKFSFTPEENSTLQHYFPNIYLGTP